MTDPNPYWGWLEEYSRLEQAAGGPDPQIELVAKALLAFDDDTAVAYAGAFVNCYTVAGAAAQWRHLAQGHSITPSWLEDVGMGVASRPLGVPMRRERRAVYGPAKFATAFTSWQQWCTDHWPHVRHAEYPIVFDTVDKHVLYFGRYATMKVLQVLYLRGLIDHGQSDIRPRDAKFPRRTLAKLWPSHAEWLLDKKLAQQPDQLAAQQRMGLAVGGRLGVDQYDAETLLCTFRQCLTGKYPGRSQDRELAFWLQADSYWSARGVDITDILPFFDLRAHLFQREYLGEHGNPPWYGARDDELKWEVRYPNGVAY